MAGVVFREGRMGLSFARLAAGLRTNWRRIHDAAQPPCDN